jgi:hypothetical protein
MVFAVVNCDCLYLPVRVYNLGDSNLPMTLILYICLAFS